MVQRMFQRFCTTRETTRIIQHIEAHEAYEACMKPTNWVEPSWIHAAAHKEAYSRATLALALVLVLRYNTALEPLSNQHLNCKPGLDGGTPHCGVLHLCTDDRKDQKGTLQVEVEMVGYVIKIAPAGHCKWADSARSKVKNHPKWRGQYIAWQRAAVAHSCFSTTQGVSTTLQPLTPNPRPWGQTVLSRPEPSAELPRAPLPRDSTGGRSLCRPRCSRQY